MKQVENPSDGWGGGKVSVKGGYTDFTPTLATDKISMRGGGYTNLTPTLWRRRGV